SAPTDSVDTGPAMTGPVGGEMLWLQPGSALATIIKPAADVPVTERNLRRFSVWAEQSAWPAQRGSAKSSFILNLQRHDIGVGAALREVSRTVTTECPPEWSSFTRVGAQRQCDFALASRRAARENESSERGRVGFRKK